MLKHFAEAQEQHDGKNTIIVFKEGMEKMLKEALKKRDFSEDAVILAKAAVIVRDDILITNALTSLVLFCQIVKKIPYPLALNHLFR